MSRPAAPPPDEPSNVFYLYGGTMLAVQSFERTLATLVLILNRTRRTRKLRTPEAVARALQRAMDRSIDAYQRASAKALLKMLPDDFDAELRDEIEAMCKWRDRLAHRYLIERLVRADGPQRFQPGAAEELIDLGAGFLALAAKLQAKLGVAVDELALVRRPEGVNELIASWAQAVMAGEPWRP